MKLIIFVYTASFFFATYNGYSQNKFNYDHVKNEVIKFEVDVAEWDIEHGEYYSRAIVKISNLDSNDWAALRLLKKKDWMKLLNDPNYDWAANLILYQIYEKQGYFFRTIKTRDQWVGRLKKEDIEEWKAYLKS